MNSSLLYAEGGTQIGTRLLVERQESTSYRAGTGSWNAAQSLMERVGSPGRSSWSVPARSRRACTITRWRTINDVRLPRCCRTPPVPGRIRMPRARRPRIFRALLPNRCPASAYYVAGVEWSPAPAHMRGDAYHLSSDRHRRFWFLWLATGSEWDEIYGEGVWAWAPRERCRQRWLPFIC